MASKVAVSGRLLTVSSLKGVFNEKGSLAFIGIRVLAEEGYTLIGPNLYSSEFPPANHRC